MSGRGKRKRTRVPRPRRSRGMQMDEDNPFAAMFAFMRALNTPPRSRATRSRSRQLGQLSPRRATVSEAAAVAPVVVEVDESPVNSTMLASIESKMQSFMQSGGFISDDSDEEPLVVKKVQDLNSEPKPSTSVASDPEEKMSDDIMDVVDCILQSGNDSNGEKLENQMRSLEDYRRETEELLKSTSDEINQFLGAPKPEVAKPQESPKKSSHNCPICFENLESTAASVTVCGHIFCKDCITKACQTSKMCPTCRKGITAKKIHPIYL